LYDNIENEYWILSPLYQETIMKDNIIAQSTGTSDANVDAHTVEVTNIDNPLITTSNIEQPGPLDDNDKNKSNTCIRETEFFEYIDVDESSKVIYKQSYHSVSIYIITTDSTLKAYSGDFNDLMNYKGNSMLQNHFSIKDMTDCFTDLSWSEKYRLLIEDGDLTIKTNAGTDIIKIPFDTDKVGEIKLNNIRPNLYNDYMNETRRIAVAVSNRKLRQAQQLTKFRWNLFEAFMSFLMSACICWLLCESFEYLMIPTNICSNYSMGDYCKEHNKKLFNVYIIPMMWYFLQMGINAWTVAGIIWNMPSN